MKKTKKLLNKLLEEIEDTGIIEISCQKTGISRNTFYRWMKEDKQFLEQASEAMFLGTGRVSDIAVSHLLSAIKAKDMKAIIFWLTHRHPEFKRPYNNMPDMHDLLRYAQLLNGKERALRADMEATELAGNVREEKIQEAMRDIEKNQAKWFLPTKSEEEKALELHNEWKKKFLKKHGLKDDPSIT